MSLKNTFVILFALLTMGLLTTSFLNGPANRGHDKTGSPISSGACMNCHSSGNFGPSLQVAMFDGETEVETYEPGKTYTLKYQLLNTGSPAVFGFQTVALNDNNETSGNFGSVPDGFRVITLKEVDYLEHSTPRPLSNFEVEWTAPENATDVITIYSGGVAANGNNNTGSDGADIDALTLQPNTSGIAETELLINNQLFQIKSNITRNYLTLQKLHQGENYTFNLYDSQGRLIQSFSNSSSQENVLEIPVYDLNENIYYIQGMVNGNSQTLRFFKN